MKKLLMLVLMSTPMIVSAHESPAFTTRTTFSRTTSVSTMIKADPAVIWALLTNAVDYKRWNSTVISIEGDIAPGEKIRLKSTLDPKRTFKLKVKTFESEKRMVWGDSKGNRTYLLTDKGNGMVVFSMTEKIGGLMFPLYAKYLPPFDATFDRFAADLKQEAERISRNDE